ncbi:MAG: Cof-type HAD-IIB family hydrolase [Candidatus Omnitrophica bacterium]|nr:Cof-type HAD-IIB family hydrolase [Candidatus Omnitrophota bacterium]MCM8808771.1 Cof-type HAD-IIB family hydrolase [Candidatus Omnitrophota bacterium]MCM8810982.1 Cof-type HAD-IIB family hydrolase [Candidatus Omnitrophota bacterium]MCM8833158.1 Cof-type HAD-IIB family hydrolase [Candidatus Omnitrophota bacterium]
MIKLLAIDLDGTLLDNQGKINKEDKIALKLFSKKGGIVVLASGRMTDCVSVYSKILEIDTPLIVYNGAMVRLTEKEKRKIIYHNPVPLKYSKFIIDYCFENNFLLNFYYQDILYATNNPKLKEYAEIYSKQTGAKYLFIENLKIMENKKPTKLILITDVENKDIKRTRDYQYKYFKKLFGKNLNIVKTNPEYLEFMNKGVNKGTALKVLADYYKIKREEIVAFGDGENDLEMLLYAGISVVPKNAKEKVKKFAKIVSDYSNNQAYISKFLNGFLSN